SISRPGDPGRGGTHAAHLLACHPTPGHAWPGRIVRGIAPTWTASIRLSTQECRDVQVAAVVAAEVGRGRRRRSRGLAAVAAAQGRGDALAGPERRGFVDQHAGGAVAAAVRANQLHLRLAHDVVAETAVFVATGLAARVA